jgi:hypothetical protein
VNFFREKQLNSRAKPDVNSGKAAKKIGKIVKFYPFYLMSKFKITDINGREFYHSEKPKV